MSPKARRGDRRDGRRIRDIDGVHAIMPYLMPNRCDSEVYIQEDIDVTDLMTYLAARNTQEAPFKTTPFHAFVMAMAKTVYFRPHLNRFISGKRYYQRHEITMSFVIKRKFQDGAEEMLMTLTVDENMVLRDISKKIVGETTELRAAEGSNDIDQVLGTLRKLPRFFMRFTMMIFRFLDFHGWMPAFICDGDTNYSTVLLSNLGSIKCNPAYHHLNNYGTNSIVITIGEIRKTQVIDEEGKVQLRDIVSLGATVDERISDGFYFSKSIALLKKILARPDLLDRPIKEEIDHES